LHRALAALVGGRCHLRPGHWGGSWLQLVMRLMVLLLLLLLRSILMVCWLG
jgi:hypothetical protein